MTSRIIYQYADYDGEKSTVSFNIDSLANEAALTTAVEAVTIGELQQRTDIDDTVQISSDNAASQWAQRELGLRVHLADGTTGESGYVTIPCPDLDNLTAETDGSIDLTDAGIMAALVTQIEAHVLSRDGNAVTVVRAEVVGRNN